MELNGKYGKAIVYTDDIEQEAISQIINLLNQPMTKDASVRIMPDTHAGKGCVIGYTAKLTDKIVPNLIGVDIGCGVIGAKIGNLKDVGKKFDKLDKFIRENVPSGRDVRSGIYADVDRAFHSLPVSKGVHWNVFKDWVDDIASRTHQDHGYIYQSLGSLGGGNHFIEVDIDDDKNLWLVVHSGSRNFGLQIAKYYQNWAEEKVIGFDHDLFQKKVEEIKKTKKGKGIEVAIKTLRTQMSKRGKATGLEYLEGADAQAYFRDMNVAQAFAQLSRRIMIDVIMHGFYKQRDYDIIESVHNYINFEDNIIRKGAISAHANEKVIIPLNMADGTIIGTGKGNVDWNNSAPHGAGRKMSRSKAKASIPLEQFQKIMKDRKVWTSSVGKSTLDEAPQAYKDAKHIINYLKDSVDIESHMKPVYNWKASE